MAITIIGSSVDVAVSALYTPFLPLYNDDDNTGSSDSKSSSDTTMDGIMQSFLTNNILPPTQLCIALGEDAEDNVKSLFRKLATSLPGAYATNGNAAAGAGGSNVIDIKLSQAPANLDEARGCGC